MPYLTSFYRGLNRIGSIILDLIPKYYVTPRSLPTRKANGLRGYQIVNDDNNKESVSLDYKSDTLQIKIEAGVNSAVEKSMALQQIIQLMGASELFSEFINTKGLETILDNVDIRGIDSLKEKAAQFMQEKEQAAQQQKPDPVTQAIEAEVHMNDIKTAQKAEQAQGEIAVKSAQVEVDHQKAQTETLKVIAELDMASAQQLIAAEKHNAEMSSQAIESALAIAKHHAEQSIVAAQQGGQQEQMQEPSMQQNEQ